MQAAPFTLAYQHQFGSVEADVHLRNDTLFVAHDDKDISADRTFDTLYLQQIAKQVSKNHLQNHVAGIGENAGAL